MLTLDILFGKCGILRYLVTVILFSCFMNYDNLAGYAMLHFTTSFTHEVLHDFLSYFCYWQMQILEDVVRYYRNTCRMLASCSWSTPVALCIFEPTNVLNLYILTAKVVLDNNKTSWELSPSIYNIHHPLHSLILSLTHTSAHIHTDCLFL